MPIVEHDQLSSFVGKPLTAADWLRIDQSRIDSFADVTEDRQFIHIDPERAARTPFGSTIAHGLLTLALLPKLIETVAVIPANVTLGINYGFNKVRFPHPVAVDSDIRATMTLRDVRERGAGRFMLRSEVVVEIRDKRKPALVAESLALLVVE